MTMSWQAMREQATELADFGARRLADARVAYLASVDRAGAPRVHPVTPILSPCGLFVFMEATSPKGRDLERGSRYALHCAVEDEMGGGGEFRVRGAARRVTDPRRRELAATHAPFEPPGRYILFELMVDDAFSTRYTQDGTPVRQRWRAGGPPAPASRC